MMKRNYPSEKEQGFQPQVLNSPQFEIINLQLYSKLVIL